MTFSIINQHRRLALLFSVCLTLLVNGCATTSSSDTPISSSPATTAKQQPIVKPYKKPVKGLTQTAPVAITEETKPQKPKPVILKSPSPAGVSIPKKTTLAPTKPIPTKTSTVVIEKKAPVEKKLKIAPTKTATATKKVEAKQPSNIDPMPEPSTPIDTPVEAAEQLEVTLDALPINYQNWIIDKPRDQGNICVLKTQASKIEDGAGGSPVFLEINKQHLIIRTKSDVDLSYASSQLVMNNNAFKYDKVIADTHVVIENQLADALKALKTSKIATIELGFWPSWPQTQTYQSSISVQGFETAYNAWQRCNHIQ